MEGAPKSFESESDKSNKDSEKESVGIKNIIAENLDDKRDELKKDGKMLIDTHKTEKVEGEDYFREVFEELTDEEVFNKIKNGEIKSGYDLTSVTPEVVDYLVKYAEEGVSKRIDFSALKDLPKYAAEKIAKTDLNLFLRAVENLPEDVADELGKYRGPHLLFSALKELTPEAAEKLTGVPRIYFEGNTSISDEAMEELAKQKGTLVFANKNSFTDGACEALSSHHGAIEISESFTDYTGRSLGNVCDISDDGLKQLSKAHVRFWNGSTLSDKVNKIVAEK
jgi:hypothetical protein